VLVIPPTDRIPVETLRRIQQYVAAGGKAIAIGRAPALDANGHSAAEIASLSRQLFNSSTSTLVADESALKEALHKAVRPDFQLESENDDIGFIRRKLPAADIYFIANASNHPVSVRAAFATTHTFGQRWNADTGATVASYPGTATIPVNLAAYESAIFVFSNTPSRVPSVNRPGAQIADLSADWKVTFTATNRSISEHVLADWMSDPATRFYSGEAVYERDFTLSKMPVGAIFLDVDGGTALTIPAKLKGPGMRAWYDPPVREAAIVYQWSSRGVAMAPAV
jgi:hypothetical protein